MNYKTGSFKKYGEGPVFGSRETGTMFDAYTWKQNGRLRMDVSWRPKKALAVTFSDDGIHWDDPIITLECDPSTGENNLNRNCVIPDPHGNGYLMWYTSQSRSNGVAKSKICIAHSDDGIHFERILNEPVMIPETDFEKDSVMNPFVMV
jgi:hypothetical protein